jgi:thiamine-monophosphate kinase
MKGALKLSDIGEFGFIRRFSRAFLKMTPRGVTGIGDDCAVLPWGKNAHLLVTTDMLVEDIHFLRRKISPDDLGYKSLAVNLSDIAAMGGSPDSAFLSLGLASDTDLGYLDRFFRGLRALAEAEDVRLLGGDTTGSSGPLIINIAVLGRVHPDRVKFRSGARPGDILCVTGFLGDSGAGLKLLLEGCRLGKDEAYLVRRHHRPRPHLNEGAWLAGHREVMAMMDVSDGIDSDIRRIMEQSRCGAAVDLDSLPLSRPLKRVAKKRGWDARELAAAGGEDYCLLVAVAPAGFRRIAAAFRLRFGRPLYPIGKIRPKRAGFLYRLNGTPAALKRRGFDHFG